jgi:hypothetical protein
MGTLLLTIGCIALLASAVLGFMLNNPKAKMLMWAGVVACALGLGLESFIYVPQGKIAYVVYPSGKVTAVSKTGLNFIMPFSRVNMWDQYIDVAARPLDAEGHVVESDEDKDALEAVIPGGIPIRFIDQVVGNLFVSVRFEIPTDEDNFIHIANKYKTQDNLIINTFMGVIKEQATNTSYMHSAEGYVSGGASDFKQDLESALKEGGFVVANQTTRDTLWDSAIAQNGVPRRILEVKKLTMLVKQKDKNGIPLRNPHEISENRIRISQVLVNDVALEEKFRQKLEQQRDISAQRRIEAQKVETAQMAQQRILAEGESAKAAERVKQEMEQIRSLIGIETQLKREETNRQLAEIQLQTAKLAADATRAKADGESYANAKLVSAGLSPQERANWDYKTKIAVAEAFAKMTPPQMVITGGQNGGNAMESLIQANMAKQFMEK